MATIAATRTSTATATTVGTTDSTRARLLAGAVAAPVFMGLSLAQAFTRDGFDLSVHPLSFLAIGEHGWIQIANFVVNGLLIALAGTALRGTSPWAARLFTVLGLAFAAAGVFVADPAFGFGPGAPAGMPASMSWHSALHGVAFVVAMLAWLAASVVVARTYARAGRRRAAAGTLAVTLILVAAIPASQISVPLLYVASTVGFLWTAAVYADAAR